MNSSLLVRPHAPDASGTVLEVTPRSAGWEHVGFRVAHLLDGQVHAGEEAARETCLVLVAGSADISAGGQSFAGVRSEEHTSELQSLMRISYAVFCLKNKNTTTNDK